MRSKEKTTVKKKHIFLKIIVPIICIIVALILWVGIDILINISVDEAERRPSAWDNYDFTEMNQIIWLYDNQGMTHPDINYTLDNVTEKRVLDAIEPAARYMSNRYDCSDFRAIYFLKLLFDGGEELLALSAGGEIGIAIKNALTGFKFWITSEGDDSMCYYSENHQALFAAVEYLSGYAYQNEIFTIDGNNGAKHMEIARKRMLDWLDMRYTYGFSECFSSNYYPVDIAAMSLILRYGDKSDTELMKKTEIVLDLIYLDYALQMYDYTFISPAGRAYAENNRSEVSSNSYNIINYIWEPEGFEETNPYSDFSYIAISTMEKLDENNKHFYQIPEVIKAIGRETSKVVKTSTGLNLSELESENLLGLSDRQIMYQLGMGAVTNPEVIQNTLDFINEYDLLSNNFLSNFKYINIHLFQYLGLMPWLSGLVDPYTNGFALQRYNVYTYITEKYKLSTNQAYHPGSFGSQETQMTAILPGNISVFTTQPVDGNISTPGYWAGYGVAPHAVQDENVSMMIYNIPKKIAVSSHDVLPYTHTYFPEADFDEVIVDGKYAFARVADTYIALIGSSNLEYLDYDAARLEAFTEKTTGRFDLIQRGEKQSWIYELSSEGSDGSFAEFITRIKSNATSFSDNNLTYATSGKQMSVAYEGDFSVNGTVQNTEYKRVESKYVTEDRKTKTFTINLNGNSLFLDFDNFEITSI